VRVYFDPSVLVPLYVQEAASAGLREFVLLQSPQVLLNELQELELKNAIRQKVTRKEITEGTAARSLRLLDDDFVAERVVRKPVVWTVVYAQAEKLSRRLAAKQVCRSFDLLHVAIAVASKVKRFATFDQDQMLVARAARLKVVELPSGR
jgi:predicted nucleic acid-binding protein